VTRDDDDDDDHNNNNNNNNNDSSSDGDGSVDTGVSGRHNKMFIL
jgi:hypothetical protein